MHSAGDFLPGKAQQTSLLAALLEFSLQIDVFIDDEMAMNPFSKQSCSMILFYVPFRPNKWYGYVNHQRNRCRLRDGTGS